MFLNMTVISLWPSLSVHNIYLFCLSMYLFYLVFLSVRYMIVSVSTSYLSGLYTDPSEGGPTHRRSWVPSLVIHQFGAVQRHPLGSGRLNHWRSYMLYVWKESWDIQWKKWWLSMSNYEYKSLLGWCLVTFVLYSSTWLLSNCLLSYFYYCMVPYQWDGYVKMLWSSSLYVIERQNIHCYVLFIYFFIK